jgi:hypothetical protein
MHSRLVLDEQALTNRPVGSSSNAASDRVTPRSKIDPLGATTKGKSFFFWPACTLVCYSYVAQTEELLRKESRSNGILNFFAGLSLL